MKQARIISAGGCLAALLLAGCAGVSPNSTVNPLGEVAPQRAQSTSFTRNVGLSAQPSVFASHRRVGGESLNATSYSYQCEGTKHPLLLKVTFTASGEATGPFPGTFTASGVYDWDDSVSGLGKFREGFTITSGKRTLTGRIHLRRSGPSAGCNFIQSGQYGYTLGYRMHDDRGRVWAGNAGAYINDPTFAETLK